MDVASQVAEPALTDRRLAAGSVHGEVARCLVIATAATIAVLALAPPPGDASAHLYRTWLVERGVWWWDNLWFAGSHPVATYSPLYYVLSALLGATVVPVIGVLASAACFTALVVREWGDVAVWPARVFAVCAVGPLITGTAPYGLGLAAGLAALLAFQHRFYVLGALAAVLTVAFSALAFLFLVLVLSAVAVSRRCAAGTIVKVVSGVGLAACLWLASRLVFPEGGRYPFLWWTLLAVVALTVCLLAITSRAPAAGFFTALFALWLLGSIALFVVPTPIGEIVTRLRYLILPLTLLAVGVAGWRPRWLALLAISGAAVYNVAPYAASLAVRIEGDRNASEQEFWQPAIDFLVANADADDHLVEVVATGAHWEAYHLPRSGLPVVRGWYRQIDMVRNEVLYDAGADPDDYVEWLHDNAVRYVVLPDIRLDPHTGERETELLEAAEGTRLVMRTDDLTIYEVLDPTPLLTGRGEARVVDLTHEAVAGEIDEPGVYRLRLAWSPHLDVVEGDVTVHARADGQIMLRAGSPGPFRLEVRPEISLDDVTPGVLDP